MDIMDWMIGSSLMCVTAHLWTAFLRFNEFKDRTITVFLLWVALACGSIFVAGAVLGSLNNATFLFINVIIFSISFLIFRSRARRPSLPSIAAFIKSQRAGGLAVSYGLLLTVFLLLTAYIGYLLPPYAYDELSYHLVSVAAWVHNQRIMDSGTMWADVYPKNAEFLFTWLYMSVHADTFVHLGQWFFSLAGIAAVMGTTRLLGLARRYAVIAGTLFFVAPTTILQATTNYTDLAYASVFLIFFYYYLRYLQTVDRRYIFLSGISAGIALGVKSTALMYVGACCVVVLVHYVFWLRQKRITRQHVMLDILVFALPCLALGTYWYIHTWIHYGNPIYPFTVAFHGITVFPGEGSVKHLIMDPNTPSNLIKLPWWQQVWISWMSIPTMYSYDMRISGFGVQWPFLELPALLVFAVYLLLRDRRLFCQVIVPLSIIFVIEPANWWGRYTLFMVALGGWAVVYMVNLVRKSWLRTAIYGCVLVAICGSYVVVTALVMSNKHMDAGLVAQSTRRALNMPARNRSTGSVVFPDYRWVDTLHEPTNLGIDPSVPFPYVFYGRSAQNSVTIMNEHTRISFARAAVAQHAQYIITAKEDIENEWARQDRRLFKLIGEHWNYNVYQVTR